MAEKMLIDASHPEETRVVVVRGSRIEEFDFESEHKKQIKGNIYLAKVTRVEPSLQAAFVDYGGNRHGFLAFAEIHPDYYQIPLADRQALLQAEAEDARNDPDFESADRDEVEQPPAKPAVRKPAAEVRPEPKSEEGEEKGGKSRPRRSRRGRKRSGETGTAETEAPSEGDEVQSETASIAEAVASLDEQAPGDGEDDDTSGTMAAAVDAEEISEPVGRDKHGESDDDSDNGDGNGNGNGRHREAPPHDNNVESVGAEDALEELPERPVRKPRKQYRIQEVIKRRQIILVQVVKEERGNKGAALTTYLSLAGRYSVLMPNTARGGGISRKITNVVDRKRLKEIARELEVPQGMGVILRTAGANRTKVEVKRDFEYLMRLWDNVRSLTLKSTAPSLVYEEGSLIKRSIRDLYNKDISEIIVAGENGYREAKDFMKMLMPSHAKVVQPYRDLMPIFARSGIEAQLDRMLQPQVTLKSGGYIIINQTEALVAIDVNSGRSTREYSIEDTALQTNLEAADEIARQLRLRDLAGLIVIDFIDMEENRNNRAVEKRVKDCLKSDRARIQVGRISHFGLLEMSRQRIRASVLESTTQVCPHCGGVGYIRSESSVALHVLRGIEEHLLKNTTHHVTVRTAANTALYMLNHKRDTIVDLERRFGLSITFSADEGIGATYFAIDRGATVENPVSIEHIAAASNNYVVEDDDDTVIIEEEDVSEDVSEDVVPDEAASEAVPEPGNGESREDGQGKKRRRRRRRGGRKPEGEANGTHTAQETNSDDEDGDEEDDTDATEGGVEVARTSAPDAAEAGEESSGKRRRRGKRGGRRNREDGQEAQVSDPSGEVNDDMVAAQTPEAEPEAEPLAGPEAELEAQPEAEPVAQVALVDIEPEAEAPEAPVEVQAEVPVKPARRKRVTKAQAAKLAEEEAAAAAAASEPDAGVVEAEAAVDETDVGGVVPDTPVETADQAAEPEPEDNPDASGQSVATEPVVTSSSAQADSDKPKKGGWWQKRGFF